MEPKRRSSAPSVLAKAAKMLDALSDLGVAGVSEISRTTGLAKTTVHRTAKELEAVGLVERAGDAYRLAPKLFELGNRVPGRRSFRDAALPFLEHLAYTTNQTVHLGALVGTEVIYLERLVGGKPSEVPSSVASRFPLHCTATGKCLLAFGPPELAAESLGSGNLQPLTQSSITNRQVLEKELEEIRRSGVATERNEVAIGFCSTAAPVRKSRGVLAGALSATGPIDGYPVDHIEELVQEAARALSERLGHRPKANESR